MSYDIWLEIDTGGSELKEVADIGNMTSNVSGMWYDALGHNLGDYHGKACADVIEPLQKAVALYATDQSVQKSQVIEDALTEFFKTGRGKGCDPNALPTFNA